MKQPRRRKRLNPNTLLLIKQTMLGVLFAVFVSLLVLSVWYVTRIPALTIQEVTVSGGETISHELVKKLVETELDGKYIRLVPKRFAFLYPKNSIEKSVMGVDRIKNFQIQRNSFTKLHVEFSEFVPDSLWCSDTSDRCVFIDQTGYAFAKAPLLTGGSFLRLDKLGVKPVTNIQVFDTDVYSQIKQLVSLLESNGWFVDLVETDVAGDAYVTLVEGGELKVALKDEPEQIVENLFTVLSSADFTHIKPGNFEYIDLRFGNKVFVNEELPEVATSTEDGLSSP